MTRAFRRRFVLVVAALVWVGGLPHVVRGQEGDDLASPKLRVSWDAFKKLHDDNTVVVVDVRARESFEAGHIPGARNVPLQEIEKQAPALRSLRKPIVLYCA